MVALNSNRVINLIVICDDSSVDVQYITVHTLKKRTQSLFHNNYYSEFGDFEVSKYQLCTISAVYLPHACYYYYFISTGYENTVQFLVLLVHADIIQ